jgi:hypothetical protein
VLNQSNQAIATSYPLSWKNMSYFHQYRRKATLLPQIVSAETKVKNVETKQRSGHRPLVSWKNTFRIRQFKRNTT